MPVSFYGIQMIKILKNKKQKKQKRKKKKQPMKHFIFMEFERKKKTAIKLMSILRFSSQVT